MAEKNIFFARAVVYFYDTSKNTWAPSQIAGYSRVDIYENTSANTYRVIGRGLQETSKIVINSNITKDITYSRASENFHQWSDGRLVYGLTFATKEEAESFGSGFEDIVRRLKDPESSKPEPPSPVGPASQTEQQEEEHEEEPEPTKAPEAPKQTTPEPKQPTPEHDKPPKPPAFEAQAPEPTKAPEAPKQPTEPTKAPEVPKQTPEPPEKPVPVPNKPAPQTPTPEPTKAPEVQKQTSEPPEKPVPAPSKPTPKAPEPAKDQHANKTFLSKPSNTEMGKPGVASSSTANKAGTTIDYAQFKEEILAETRKEIRLMKEEILAAIKSSQGK